MQSGDIPVRGLAPSIPGPAIHKYDTSKSRLQSLDPASRVQHRFSLFFNKGLLHEIEMGNLNIDGYVVDVTLTIYAQKRWVNDSRFLA
jgi:hypothetical protein